MTPGWCLCGERESELELLGPISSLINTEPLGGLPQGEPQVHIRQSLGRIYLQETEVRDDHKRETAQGHYFRSFLYSIYIDLSQKVCTDLALNLPGPLYALSKKLKH